MFLTTGILRAGGEFLNLKTGIPGGACGKYRKLPKSSKNYSFNQLVTTTVVKA